MTDTPIITAEKAALGLIPQPYRLLAEAVAVVLALILLGFVLTRFGFVFDPLHTKDKTIASLSGQLELSRADTAVAKAQAAAGLDAAHIVDHQVERTNTTNIIHESNADAIRTAPGADAPLDPGLVAAIDHGLCRYEAYALDPGCGPLRGADPRQLPQADSGRPAP